MSASFLETRDFDQKKLPMWSLLFAFHSNIEPTHANAARSIFLWFQTIFLGYSLTEAVTGTHHYTEHG